MCRTVSTGRKKFLHNHFNITLQNINQCEGKELKLNSKTDLVSFVSIVFQSISNPVSSGKMEKNIPVQLPILPQPEFHGTQRTSSISQIQNLSYSCLTIRPIINKNECTWETWQNLHSQSCICST